MVRPQKPSYVARSYSTRRRKQTFDCKNEETVTNKFQIFVWYYLLSDDRVKANTIVASLSLALPHNKSLFCTRYSSKCGAKVVNAKPYVSGFAGAVFVYVIANEKARLTLEL